MISPLTPRSVAPRGHKRSVGILAKAARGDVLHAIMPHVTNTKIDVDRCALPRHRHQYARAGGFGRGEVPVEIGIGIVAAAAMGGAVEERATHGPEAIQTNRSPAQHDLWSDGRRAHPLSDGTSVAL